MTNEPIGSREFNATVQALRDKQDEFQSAVLKSLEDGFASVRTRFEGIERETDRLSDLAIKQAEHNGAIRSQIEQAKLDILTEKARGDKHNAWIVGAMGTLIVSMLGGIATWFRIK